MGDCKHYWVIDADQQGKCALCGATKDFTPKKPKRKPHHEGYLNQVYASWEKNNPPDYELDDIEQQNKWDDIVRNYEERNE